WREPLVGRPRLGLPRRPLGLRVRDAVAPGSHQLPAPGRDRAVGPEGLTDLRFERQRRQLIEVIRERGIEDLEVLNAFDRVPRHLFLPEAVRHRAYEDTPLP